MDIDWEESDMEIDWNESNMVIDVKYADDLLMQRVVAIESDRNVSVMRVSSIQ